MKSTAVAEKLLLIIVTLKKKKKFKRLCHLRRGFEAQITYAKL